jgi:hypothetical protein
MVDVFISYSREDRAAVARLAGAVEAAGYDVWWDDDLPPHMSYGDVITAKIGAAKAAIVVWSKSSVQSEWVRAEADVARNQKKLIQTALDNVMPPLPFNQIQFAEMGDWQGEPDHPGWRKVKASLSELCGPRDQATTAAAPVMATGPAMATAPSPAAAMRHQSVLPPQSPAGAGGHNNRTLIFGGLAALGAAVLLTAGVMLGRGSSDDETPAAGDAAAGGAQALVSPNAPASSAPSAAPTTAAASSAPAASASDEQDRHVVIMNLSSQTLRELYASPVTSDNWEEDLLGQSVLAAGESINANIDNGTGECMYDLKAVMSDDTEHVRNRVNVCEVSRWSVGDSGDSTS